jgi:hypothetical protein
VGRNRKRRRRRRRGVLFEVGWEDRKERGLEEDVEGMGKGGIKESGW